MAKRITQHHLHAMQIEVLAKRGSSEPLPETDQLKILLPLKTDIEALKKGGADYQCLLRLREVFMLSTWAAREIDDALVKRRGDLTKAANNAVVDMIKTKRYVAKGSELKTIDEAYNAVAELHGVLPEWCFLKAGLDLIKLTHGRVRRNKR